MDASWTGRRSRFKSPLRVVAWFLERSRETKSSKCRKLRQELNEANRELARFKAQAERDRKEICTLKQQVRCLETEKQIQAQSTRLLPADPPIGSHGFGPRMVCLATELARTVGLRGAERTIKIVFDWLDVQQKIPVSTTIRIWMQRLGVAALNEPVEEADDWVWMADHSNQIGQEKVLVVLAVRASAMPPPGTALKHEDVRVLAERPGTTWKREDVAAVYGELAEQYGSPRALVTDGAVELRESIECLKKRRSDVISLQDFKHKAANLLKASLGKDDRFAEFNTLLGRTRSAIQQTELAHLTPLGQKQKARFMNLGATLNWAAMVLWLLEYPEAKAREFVTSERLDEKLGWLRSFADDLAAWRECQRVIDAGLSLINEHGIFCGAAEQLRAAVGTKSKYAAASQLAERLIEFVSDAEILLEEGERLPMSTEILESSFALYKQLERQHSKGGFTSLLAAFGALLKKPTPETVRRAFSDVSVKDVKQWVHDNLGATVTSKRRQTYNEFKKAENRATNTTAAA